MQSFADVILPLPLGKYFTYEIPQEFFSSLKVGSRVIVPFGRKRYYTAIVRHIHNSPPCGYEIKEIQEVLDPKPVLCPMQLKFWEWIADYYLCSVGDVYKAALPSGLKLESETKISVNTDYLPETDAALSPKEEVIFEFVKSAGTITVLALERGSGIKNALPVVRSLLERSAIIISEEIRRKYRPKTELCVKLSFGKEDKEMLRGVFDSLSGAKKQMKLLVAFIEMSGFTRPGQLTEVARQALLLRADVAAPVLLAMIEKGIFLQYKREVSRLGETSGKIEDVHDLNSAQQEAYRRTIGSFADKNVTLLHGVTSSGKTEIYIHLINEVIKSGKQALFLVPEIALTAQLANRLARVFGNKLGVYHSKFTDNERVEIWNSLLHDSGIQVVLGVRSSIFLPFRNLGIIIVDEEHENSYKQQDPAPRYNARNAAIVLAAAFGAKTLLGSATPSIESYFNAQGGKYGFVQLLSRYEDILLPSIEIADTRELRRKKILKGDITPRLKELADEALARGGQIILFRNRRGFAPMVECKVCAWIPKCKNCDVSLTYHKRLNQLTCHYCGYTYDIPRRCPACGSDDIEVRGFGTEHIEEEAESLFEGYPVSRMDLDTTRSRKAYEEIISDFENRRTRILIGTQMVAKGLDFDNVSVVGILGADTLLNFPDFRAHERAFQLMEQVAGRAGRSGHQGMVVLQTSQPEHPIIGQLIGHDYEGMYNSQLEERRSFNYPPFSRLIYIYMKGGEEVSLDRAAKDYATYMCKIFAHRVLGPDQPPVARIQSLFIRKIVLKIETNASIANVRGLLQNAHLRMTEMPAFKGITLYYDVDPM
ncbi:MAG: primosomal protein N' [Bacteroidales bacterium]